jgi:UDP-N-acetylmuramate--alanine ligase
MLDIYAASEEPIPGITTQALVAAIRRPEVEYAESTDAAIAQAMRRAQQGDVILTLGAGSVSHLAPLVVERLGD